eukprot:TRINITY_DN68031_c6_g8_i2.p1 TRINITY_DN68031_c6_g8~~TRINITY_DN68031_c6_g8_i2.p1  ORF type:complete len:190 (+),score=16.29 TRINITY_DN68031_c6_g8_i2:41-610(+)
MSWSQLDGALVQVLSNNDTIVGVNAEGSIFRRSIGGGDWEQLEGNATCVDIDNDGTLWCVNGEGSIFRWNGGGWDQQEGNAVRISCGGGQVWCLNGENQIFQYVAEFFGTTYNTSRTARPVLPPLFPFTDGTVAVGTNRKALPSKLASVMMVAYGLSTVKEASSGVYSPASPPASAPRPRLSRAPWTRY